MAQINTVYDQGHNPSALPKKEKGKHRWVVIATYCLTEDQIISANRGKATHLDHENRFSITSGCIDCEVVFTEENRKQPCTSSGSWQELEEEQA